MSQRTQRAQRVLIFTIQRRRALRGVGYEPEAAGVPNMRRDTHAQSDINWEQRLSFFDLISRRVVVHLNDMTVAGAFCYKKVQ